MLKKRLKSVIAVILSVIMVSSMFIVAMAKPAVEQLPIIYVLGKVDVIYENKDEKVSKKNKVLYPLSIDYILEQNEENSLLSEALKKYATAFLTEYAVQNATEQQKLEAWDNYGVALYEFISPFFERIALDENGEPKDNSGIIWDWNKNYRDFVDGKITEEEYKYNLTEGSNPILTDTMDDDGNYPIDTENGYYFHYDWRLDMYENAEQLNAYIDDVLAVTGKDQCILISRCYGCNLVGAYFQPDDESLRAERYKKVNTNILYCSTASGTVVCSEMFCGRFNISAEGMANYMDDLLFGEGYGLLNGIIELSAKSQPNSESYETLANVINKIYSRISHVTMPETLIRSFASMPGYWSLVNENYFEEAKDFVFGATKEEQNVFSGLINKIDYYHYTVTVNARDILYYDLIENGTKYANIVKYGTQIAPMVETCDVLSDGIVEIPSASFGAKCCKIGEQFSPQYLMEAQEKGTLKYIDPDSTIDASTCVSPDHTWFAEGIDHFDFPESVNKLLLAIARSKGELTVFDDVRFPQYNKYDGEGNLVTWAGGLYLENSQDEAAKTINKILKTFLTIFTLVKRFLGFIKI